MYRTLITPFERWSLHPIRVLAVGVALTLVLFALLGWTLRSTYGRQATIVGHSHLHTLNAKIVHLDEVLTMSAWMAAVTGDQRWEDRYRMFEPQLKAAIDEAVEIAAQVPEAGGAIQVQAANRDLVQLEMQAIKLARGGRREKAIELLSSEDYEQYKRTYARGTENVIAATQNRIDTDLALHQRRVFFVASIGMVSLAILLATWLTVLILLRYHLTGRKRAEKALRQAHDELEERVQDRTEHLAAANRELQQEIADRKRVEAELAQTTAQLKRLARHQIHIEEELRRQIARELHDELGQSLTALLVDVQRHAGHKPDQSEWNGVVNDLKRAIKLVREISYGLRPPELEVFGLVKSLESLATSVDRSDGTTVRLEAPFNQRMPIASELCLYRVTQEALTNAMRHGRATRINVVLQEVEGCVVLSISDNGKGFNEHVVRSRKAGTKRRGMGLLGMRERVAEFGGTLTVRSAPGKGTRISARLSSSGKTLTERSTTAYSPSEQHSLQHSHTRASEGRRGSEAAVLATAQASKDLITRR